METFGSFISEAKDEKYRVVILTVEHGDKSITAKKLSKDSSIHGECFNFGPHNQESRTVESICLQVKDIIPEVKFLFNEKEDIESNLLQLDCSKCKNILNYSSRFDSYQAVDMTTSWYKEYMKEKSNLIELTDEQIKF